MNTIEEQIWNYLDGNCTAEEQKQIELLIQHQEEWKTAFTEIQVLQQDLQQMELEEPSMSFTRNVMEQVKLEPTPIALKTQVDQKIIKIIGGFFILMMAAILIYAIALSKPSLPEAGLQLSFSAPDLSFLSKMQSPGFLRVFLFTDLLLALVYLDCVFLRRKRIV